MHQDLSPREREVVALVADGMTNKEIALALQLRQPTVKGYLESARLKTGATNRVELTNWWHEHERGG